MKPQISSILIGTQSLQTWKGALSSLLLSWTAALVLVPNLPVLASEFTTNALPSLFVAPLHGDARIGYWQPAVGDGLAEMLITEVTKLGKFRVLESTTLENIKDEIHMGEDGWIAASEKVEKGAWTGADYMFVGKVTRFASKKKKFGGSLGPIHLPFAQGAVVSTSEAEVAIDWRIVDTASRDVVKAGRGQGKEVGTSWGFAESEGTGFVREHEFLDSALGKATMKAINDILTTIAPLNLGVGTRTKLQVAKAEEAAAKERAVQDALRSTPGVVKAVTPDYAVVSLGAKHGLKPGDKMDFFEVSEVRNKKGEVVMRDEKSAGQGIVQSVQEENSKVTFAEDTKLDEGWVVRIVSPDAD